MLTIPVVLTHGDIAVYPDDEDPDVFYLLRTRPRLRVEDGEPVFRAVFWTDDQPTPTTPRGSIKGALLHFDVNLAITEDEEDAIKQKIEASGIRSMRRQEIVDAEYERLQNLARARGEDPQNVDRPEVAAGGVRFGSVRFTGGQVTLLEEEDGGFVEWSSAGGPPSLIGDNNAAFAMRLGPTGAAVWYHALKEGAAAVGVRYELTFEVRLPSLEIHVWAGSYQDNDITRHATEQIEGGGACTDGHEDTDVHSITQTLVEAGLVRIEIIKGSSKVSDEDVGHLRTLAIDMVSERVKEIIMTRTRGLTEDERRNSLIHTLEEEVTSFVDLRLRQRDVVEWNVNPQATITPNGTVEDFLGAEIVTRNLYTLVNISDPVVEYLEVDVSADAPWDAEPKVTKVVVTVEYPHDPDEPHKQVEFSGPGEPQQLVWKRKEGDSGTVRYFAKAYLEGFAEPIELPSGRSNGVVHVQVPAVGAFEMSLRPHPETFALRGAGAINAVEVKMEYGSSGDDDYVADTVLLNADDVEGRTKSWRTGHTIDKPATLTPIFQRPDRPAVEGQPIHVWFPGGQPAQVDLTLPYEDSLRIAAEVPPGLPGVDRVVVEITHFDPSGDFESDGLIALGGDGSVAEDWSGATNVVQMSGDAERFRWRYKAYGDQQIATSPWKEAEGDTSLVLPLMSVEVNGARLNLGTDHFAAMVTLHYEDSDGVTVHQEVQVNADNPVRHILVPRVDSANDAYRYDAQFVPMQGDTIRSEGLEGSGGLLFLSPPEPE